MNGNNKKHVCPVCRAVFLHELFRLDGVLFCCLDHLLEYELMLAARRKK